jgi:exoribonuclease R
MQTQDIENRFAFHPASTQEKRNEHGAIRTHCKELAFYLEEKLPEGREKALAITKLEETMFWANAAAARDISTMSEI